MSLFLSFTKARRGRGRTSERVGMRSALAGAGKEEGSRQPFQVAFPPHPSCMSKRKGEEGDGGKGGLFQASCISQSRGRREETDSPEPSLIHPGRYGKRKRSLLAQQGTINSSISDDNHPSLKEKNGETGVVHPGHSENKRRVSPPPRKGRRKEGASLGKILHRDLPLSRKVVGRKKRGHSPSRRKRRRKKRSHRHTVLTPSSRQWQGKGKRRGTGSLHLLGQGKRKGRGETRARPQGITFLLSKI